MPARPPFAALPRFAATLLLAGVALWGHAAAPPASTTAAQVNGTAITRAELDQLMASASAQAPANGPDGNAAASQLAGVNQLITRQLLSQAALRAGLNTQSATRLQLARARRQVLGQAYLKRALASVAQPTEQQVDQYIAHHPKLFSERLTYHFTRATLDATDDWHQERLQRELQVHKTLPALQHFFQRNKLQLRAESLWLGSEQIDPDQLKVLDRMANGQLQWFVPTAPGQPVLLLRQDVYPDPKDPAKIRSAISRGLWLEAVDAARREHLEQLRLQAAWVIPPATQTEHGNQTVAQVNAEVITQAELDLALDPGLADAGVRSTASQARQQAMLTTLMEETLLAQQALTLSLEQQPAIVAQLQQLETTLLINRYLAQAMAKLPAPSLGRVNQLLARQPALFAQRQVYRFSEIILNETAAAQHDQATQALSGLTQLPAIEQKLTQLGWAYRVNHLWRGPEQLNPAYREALASLATNSHAVLPATGRQTLVVLHKAAQYPDPISAEQAQEIARQWLIAVAQSEATQALLTRLRSEARVALAPDLMAAQQQLMAPAFRLQALTTQQQQIWLLATLQVMALVLLPATLLWFYRTSRGRVEFAIWRDAPTRWRDRWNEASHAAPFFGMLAVAAGAITLLLALPLWGLLKRQALPADGLVIAGAVGVGLVSTVLVLFWLHSRQAQARAGDANRWLPMGAVLLLQALLTLVAIYAF